MWENWSCNTISTALTQDVEDIFDKSYVPSTTNDIDILSEYIYIIIFC